VTHLTAGAAAAAARLKRLKRAGVDVKPAPHKRRAKLIDKGRRAVPADRGLPVTPTLGIRG